MCVIFQIYLMYSWLCAHQPRWNPSTHGFARGILPGMQLLLATSVILLTPQNQLIPEARLRSSNWITSYPPSEHHFQTIWETLLQATLSIIIFTLHAWCHMCTLSDIRAISTDLITSLSATIVLHDPHADVRRSGCISALKILTAARAILDLIYNVWSTSFDISLLDSFCSVFYSFVILFPRLMTQNQFAWFFGGRVLVRFLQAAMDTKSQDQISTLRAELGFVQYVFTHWLFKHQMIISCLDPP